MFLHSLQNIRHYWMYSNISFTVLEIESLWWPLLREISRESNLNNSVWKKLYSCYVNYSFIIAHRAIPVIAFLQIWTMNAFNYVGVMYELLRKLIHSPGVVGSLHYTCKWSGTWKNMLTLCMSIHILPDFHTGIVPGRIWMHSQCRFLATSVIEKHEWLLTKK